MKPVSIMIVENNPNFRNILRHAFEDRGYITWTCPAPEIAVSMFGAIQPSVVLLDLDFEGASLLGLIDDWKEVSPETRVIVESAAGDAEQMREAIDRGAQAFLVKPYSLGPLFELLENDVPPAAPAAAMLKKAAA